jgi:hypothetical protein
MGGSTPSGEVWAPVRESITRDAIFTTSKSTLITTDYANLTDSARMTIRQKTFLVSVPSV